MLAVVLRHTHSLERLARAHMNFQVVQLHGRQHLQWEWEGAGTNHIQDECWHILNMSSDRQ